jgi:polyisoprenoid-binding protein YceI
LARFEPFIEENFVYPILTAFFSIAAVVNAGSQEASGEIDTLRSSITIHVRKAGLFAVAAHEHWVDAPIADGTIDAAGATPRVQFRVDSRKLSVKPEAGVSDKDQAEVQANMQAKVLESAAYPEIVFRSTQVRPYRDNAWRVTGELTLHGVTRSVTIDASREGGAYVGAVRIKQTDFGIQPIKIGGGVVRVKDELEITFHVYTQGT